MTKFSAEVNRRLPQQRGPLLGSRPGSLLASAEVNPSYTSVLLKRWTLSLESFGLPVDIVNKGKDQLLGGSHLDGSLAAIGPHCFLSPIAPPHCCCDKLLVGCACERMPVLGLQTPVVQHGKSSGESLQIWSASFFNEAMRLSFAVRNTSDTLESSGAILLDVKNIPKILVL